MERQKNIMEDGDGGIKIQQSLYYDTAKALLVLSLNFVLRT